MEMLSELVDASPEVSALNGFSFYLMVSNVNPLSANLRNLISYNMMMNEYIILFRFTQRLPSSWRFL